MAMPWRVRFHSDARLNRRGPFSVAITQTAAGSTGHGINMHQDSNLRRMTRASRGQRDVDDGRGSRRGGLCIPAGRRSY